MKTLIVSLIATFCLGHLSLATVRTVSNDPAGGAQYASLETAYADAVDGDTLHLEGTHIPYNYGYRVNHNKSLTIIGIGFNPDKQNPRLTFIAANGRTDIPMQSDAFGSQFHGIVFISPIRLYSAVSNVTFENCRFDKYIDYNNQTSTDFAFRNCIFNDNNNPNIYFGDINVTQSGVISNCIFDGYIEGRNNQYTDFIIEHCIFLRNNGSMFNQLHYTQIRDCIFMNYFPSGTSNCEYLNNMAAVAGTFPPLPANGNTASGNIENTDPLFVNYTAGSTYSTIHDYHLQAGSAAIGSANDGTDIGIHGGTSNFSEQGEVLINPIVREVNILNTTVAPNGSLNVQIKATKPSDN